MELYDNFKTLETTILYEDLNRADNINIIKNTDGTFKIIVNIYDSENKQNKEIVFYSCIFRYKDIKCIRNEESVYCTVKITEENKINEDKKIKQRRHKNGYRYKQGKINDRHNASYR